MPLTLIFVLINLLLGYNLKSELPHLLQTDGGTARNYELVATLAPAQLEVGLGEPLQLLATLQNEGRRPLRVFKEPSIDQAKMLHNSWICEIRLDDKEYIGWMKWHHSVYPMAPRLRKTKTIRLGGSVSTAFDLQDWYPLYSLGVYQVRTVYIQEELPEIGIKKLPPVYSNWITVVVK